MDLSASVEVFLSRHSNLPHELQHALRQPHIDLPAFAGAALDPRWTTSCFTHLEQIFADVCARWSQSNDFAIALAAFGRVIPLASHLAEYAQAFLQRHAQSVQFLWTSIAEQDLVEVLLAMFRLLVANRDLFKKYFDLVVLYEGLQQESRPVRYLCIRILSVHLQAADATTEELIRKHLSTEAVNGVWEDKSIDYTFLSLWEEKRAQDVEVKRNTVASFVKQLESTHNQLSVREQDLSPLTVAIFGSLMPRLGTDSTSRSKLDLVHTNTTVGNVRRFTNALMQEPPILLTGLAGSGKSSIVTYCAQHLNKHESMVTLHLNEQSDAKMLVGMYTSGTTPGTFVWQAGVLTTAVREGRWLLIEDLDRAPNEIISVLLPLIERRELVIPSRGETIKAAPGFKIIATMRTTRDSRGNESLSKPNVIGNRFWNRVMVEMLTRNELKEVVLGRFKALRVYAEQITGVFAALQDLSRNSRFATLVKAGSARPLSPRDLFKWCQRLDRHFTRHATFSDAQLDEIFLEAVDCFTGYLAHGEIFDVLTATLAEQLHIDAARRDHLIQSRAIKLATGTKGLSIGRTTLRQSSKTRGAKRQQSFAHSPHSLRLLEKLAVAVDNKEPLLLVGETGIGKTTCIQHLASTMNQKLVSFNLSQQSESGDLLGGFKPVNIRGLIMPLREEFDELFNHPLSPFAKRKEDNQHFVDMLGKALAKGQWKKICLMWKSAAAEVRKNFDKVREPKSLSRASEEHHPSKRRRTEDVPSAGGEGSLPLYQARWNKFAADIKDLEGHLASKSSAFAFKFVEGTLVKAVRNGHWVLLDEINLATPDTLEALVDLLGTSFGEAPSLLLTESGNIERVTAHPDFRVFAAMNPATDIGKKDLPPGIRSRFTELYIDSPDRDVKSLQHIVSSYLPDELGPRLVADVTNLYVDIQKFAEANTLVDGAGQKPHFSLRTLARTLVYARDVAAPVGAKDGVYRRALYEGFHMSFLTLLDSASEAVVAPKIMQHLFAKHPNAKAELNKSLPKPADGRTYVQEGHYWLHKGGFEPQAQPHYIVTPFVRRNLNNLIRAISTKKLPILIQGPTSSGKTSMVEYLAKKSGNKFVRINNHEHTDLQEYLGTYVSGADGQLRFQEGILVEALRKGYWIVLDELNLAPTDVLEALNRLLDDNRELLIPETQEIVTPHQDFMLFATQNPAGLYGGRKHLSRAFRNRFLELHFDDIPVTELCEILQQRTQIPPSWAQRIVDTYKELSSLRQENRMFEQKSFATLRDLFRWAMRAAEDKQQLAVNGHMLLAERVRKGEEREKVRAIIEQVMSRNGPNVKIDEAALYDAASSTDIGTYHHNVTSSSGVVWTKSMRRLYVLVANAIRNYEPVLLVGETGCGKTTVCQMLAEALGKELFVVNAHQNTETGDLIGSQRPVRNRTALEARLISLLKGVMPDADEAAMFEELWTAFVSLHTESKAAIPAEVLQEIDDLRAKSQALFEWSDGSLVHAMKTGQLFLLDEISLADDSVLERLNSVLEPSRTLLLAEKGATEDASVTAAEGFQFLATMNPGGDYGKRELSPALRNRFTEIWVPSLYDMDDILEIVHAKLTPVASAFAKAIVEFSSWFKQRYNSSAASAISIRDTLAWIEFINKFSDAGPVVAVLHGAAMVYIDTLGANPAAMLSISIAAIDEERKNCVEELGKLLQQDLVAMYFTVPDLLADAEQLSLGGFALPRLIDAGQDASFTFNAATTRVNAMRVFRALQLSKPLLIEGNPGVGKTTLVTAIAKAVGKKLVRINLSEQTDLMDLFGSDVPVEGGSVGTFAWRDAPFLSAMKNGDWVLLDEMNLASQSVLEGLNACLDHRAEAYIAELDQTFHRHPDFRLFAAQNPHHQGGGRKGLPASFVNRFTVVYADVFKQDDLNLICKQIFPAVDDAQIASLTSFVDKLETDVVQCHRFGALGNPWEFNLRDTMRWLQLQTKTDSLLTAGQDYDFCDVIFRQRFRSGIDREHIDKLFASCFGTAVDHRSFYHHLSNEAYQVGLGLLRRAPVTTSAPTSLPQLPPHQLPTLEGLMICVELNWPVLLTGNSGSGKTSLLNYLAAVAGRQLLTFSMNADIDAMDLVGGYEQADPSRKRADLAAKIVDTLRHLVLTAATQEPNAAARLIATIPTSIWSDVPTRDDVVKLLSSLEEARAPIFGPVISCLRDLLELPGQIEKAQFEWVNGLLVRALQRGDWLVLDNANLCSSSVLDRLNSLLEPNGYLSINEHPTEDGEPRLVKPHPDFRIFFTMDPRNGELSRAMRNRSIELYMIQDPVTLPHLIVPVLGLEASMSRYRTLLRCEEPRTLEYAVDHLSVEDLSLHDRFVTQIRQGLVPEPEVQRRATEALSLVSKLDPAWASQAIDSNATLLDVLEIGARQSIHPLNNEIIVRYNRSSFSPPSSSPVALARLYDVLLDLQTMGDAFANASAVARERRPVTPFERSVRQKSFHGGRLEDTIRVAPFLEGSLRMMMEFTSALIRDGSGSAIAFEVLKATRHFWWDLFYLVTSPIVDNAAYQVHVQLGRQAIKIESAHDQASTALVQAQTSLLQELSTGTVMTTGVHMEHFWTIFRPQLVPSMDRIAAFQNLKILADRFDTMAFPLRAPLEDLARTRDQLQVVLRASLTEEVDIKNLVEEVSTAMSTMEQSTASSATTAIFQQQFEAIYQYLRHGHTESRPSHVALLAGRSVSDSSSLSIVSSKDNALQFPLHLLSVFAHDAMVQKSPSAMAGGLASSLSAQLKSTSNVPLSQLGQFRTELDIVGKLVASHAQDLCTDQQQRVAEVFHQLLNTWKSDGQPVILSNASAPSDSNEVGLDLITYAISCLLAYVPDRAFDPALKAQIQRKLVIERRDACTGKVQALQVFERLFSGQGQSLRINLLEQELREIGGDAPALQIARPEKSQLNDLQGDFSRVIEIVRQLQAQLGSTNFSVDGSVMQNIELLVKRLTEKYLAYRDIVMPAVQWLQCLWLGLTITQRPEGNLAPAKDASSIWSSLYAVANVEAATSLSSIASSFEGIAILALDHKITGPRDVIKATMWNFFEDLFVTWKDKVNEEQAKQAKKSSLYVYRGDEDEQDQVDESEYAELFPDYEYPESHNRADAEVSATRDTAIRVAKLYADIFSPTFDTQEYILNLIKHSSEEGANPAAEGMASALPRIYLILEDQLRNVNATAINGGSYNIYQDANVPEATRLALIVRRVSARFKELQAMDFEHSTIDDVVRLASEVLSFAHTEPIAKLLTKTEKLYEAMYEWEKVSHKGLSAAPLLAELTSLLVSWRRLELSTWMQLFSIEEQKASEDAKSWWFIAYENIIANPRRLSKDDIILHAPELLKALEFFFQAATLGQFHQRLAILKQFEVHLDQASPNMPELAPLHSALSNFVAFYARFEQPIAESLNTQRSQLEKQAKEVVQLASWRDTNIEALKQSAQTSHRKLFKLVRKFRAVLNQPVSTILGVGPPDQPDALQVMSIPNEYAFDQSILFSALSISSQLPAWSHVPARFKNTVATTELMLRVGATTDRLAGGQYISDFLESLEASIRDLQKDTPSVLTDANKAEVKHLKTRKRALFADVLKQMRQMGFQYNLNSTVLAAQECTATVLAALPIGTPDVPDIRSAEYHLHKVLALMPKIREIQREHSGDLTPAEVQRSSGYLEGMLHEIIQQRQKLLPWTEQCRKLTALVNSMSSLWDAKASRPARSSQNVPKSALDNLERRLQWLSPVTKILSKVLAVQQQLANSQESAVQIEVSSFSALVERLLSDLARLQKFPSEFVLQAHEEVFRAAQETLADFNSKLILWNSHESPFVPVLRLFIPWFQSGAQDLMNGNHSTNLRTSHLSDSSLSDLLSKIIIAADAILASTQAIEEVCRDIPPAGEQPGWISLHHKALQKIFSSLNLPSITRSIDRCFRSLASADEVESSTAASLFILLQPILATYNHIVHTHLASSTDLHLSICKLSHKLTKRFVELGTKGFCTPPEKTGGETDSGQDQKLEGGTGLGEAEGAEDISKDVGDDEELTELAQERDQNEDRDEIEDEQDAVDMADEDMEGQLGDATEKDDDGEKDDVDEDEGGGPEEETGSVDDLGPEALDEKMWDEGDKVDDGEQKQNDKPQGQQNDEQVAAEAAKKNQTGHEDEKEGEEANTGAEEDEAVGQQQGEQVDDFVDETEKLDLPEDLNMDGSVGENSDDESMDDLNELEDERHTDETTAPDQLVDLSPEAEGASDGEPEDSIAGENDAAEMERDGSAEDDDVQDTDGDADMAEEEPQIENVFDDRDQESRAADDAVPSEAQGTATDAHDDDAVQSESKSQAKQDHGEQGDDVENTGGASGDQSSQFDATHQDTVGRNEDLVEATESQPFKQLGDALEKWFDQNRQIKRPDPEMNTSNGRERDVDMANADFEHLLNEESTAEAQALGTATEDQAKALNEDNAVAANENEMPLQSFVDDSDGIDEDETDAGYQTADETDMGEGKSGEENPASNESSQAPAKAFIGDAGNHHFLDDLDEKPGDESDAEDDRLEQDDATADNISDELQAVSISEANARVLWSQNELKTRTLAATLTEQLRLILAPTLATKLRGDFRTGKRLNIKRIIPYIASSYKRDKIWMRRSVPSKRAYQIMIAVDDSKSMAEHGKKDLAFETLALITKALSMLEVGELCVAGFGADVQVAHPFNKPFTDDAGVEIFSKLNFDQEDTDVRKLVVDGFRLFQEARAKASSSAQDLWQLMLIVSDAICRDSESIRRLVRKAQEEKIMIVFVVVDAGAKEVDGRKVGSIMDLQGAEFKDGQVKMYRYMDVFPFKWWIVVRDMQELPGVLSMALRQWFAEVVDTGSG